MALVPTVGAWTDSPSSWQRSTAVSLSPRSSRLNFAIHPLGYQTAGDSADECDSADWHAACYSLLFRDLVVRYIQLNEVEGFEMKKVMLALMAVAMLGACTAAAEAGWFRRAARRSYYAPVVVRPHYVAPVYVARPVYVAPPVYVARPAYRYYGAPAGVYVRGGGYYSGGGVRVHTPGFGLSISY